MISGGQRRDRNQEPDEDLTRDDDPARDNDLAAWRAQRQLIASAHAAAQERNRAQEAEQARELLREFVRAAGERGLPPERLAARAYEGGARYRTALRGWYLRRDRSIAVGVDGEFYILTVPGSLWHRITGAKLLPDRPRLIIGEGGRDGESIPLRDLLAQRLDATDD